MAAYRLCSEPQRAFEAITAENWEERSRQGLDAIQSATEGISDFAKRWSGIVADKVAASFSNERNVADDGDTGGLPLQSPSGAASSSGLSATEMDSTGGAPASSGLGLTTRGVQRTRKNEHAPSKWQEISCRTGSNAIQKYLFSDEKKDDGSVKVYVQAKDLQSVVGAPKEITVAEVSFQESSMRIRLVTSDDIAFHLNMNLCGAVYADQCKYCLSSTKQKLSITLKKKDSGIQWHQLKAPDCANNISDNRNFF